MATEINMPQLGLTMTEGTVGAWRVKVGDTVKVGDVLAEIQTDKLTTDLLSEVDGVVLQLAAAEGDDVPVQGLLVVVGAPGETVAAVAAPAASAPAAAASAPAPAPAAAAAAAASFSAPARTPGERIRISPLARRVAAANGVDITTLTGSGPSGRIVQRDVLAALAVAPAAQTAPAAVQSAPAAVSSLSGGRREKLSAMRKVVAERMFKSHSEIPVVTQTVKTDVTALLAFRKRINEGREKTFSINDLVLKAVAKALDRNRHILVSLDGNEVVHHDDVNIGMAVALEEGLIVPVIKHAETLSLEAMAARAKDLATKARSGALAVDDYQGATFSVSNLGMFGVESFTPIINQPNAAILGICSIEDELALVGGEVTVKKILRLSMTYDHRLMDGAVAAKFQLAVKALLEQPMDIVL